MEICDHSSTDTPGLYFERPGIHVSVYGLPGLYVIIDPPKLMTFDFNADPDPAFYSIADPDPQPCI